MKLTNIYSRIAIFDTKPEIIENKDLMFPSGRDSYEYDFVVDGVKYKVIIARKPEIHPNAYWVEFGIFSIVATGEERQKILEKMKDTYSRDLYRMGVEAYNYNITGIGNPVKVMSSVLHVIKSFMETHEVSMLYFSSEEKSRTDLYKRIVNRLVPPDKVKIETRMGGGVVFKLYLKMDKEDATY